MADERPVTPEMVEHARAHIARALVSGALRAALNLFGTELVVQRIGGGEFTLHAPNQPGVSRLFAASATVPVAYPEAVPFVPMEPVIISEVTPNSRSLMWLGPADDQGVYESLVNQSRSDGWIIDSESDLPQIPAKQTNLVRAGARRMIMISGGIVSLIERPD